MAKNQLKASLIIGGMLDGSLRSAFTETNACFKQLNSAVTSLKSQQQSLNVEMNAMRQSGENVTYLKTRYDTLTASIRQARDATKGLRVAEQEKARADRRFSQMRQTSMYAGIGAGTGTFALKSMLQPAGQMNMEETRLQTLGQQEPIKRAAFNFGRDMHEVGQSMNDNIATMRESLAIFGDLHEAEMAAPLMSRIKYANKTLYGASDEEADENSQNMMRAIDSLGGANDVTKFRHIADMMQQATMASGGTIKGDQWRELTQHAGIAAKSASDQSLFREMLPMMQDMGASQVGTSWMSLYQNLYSGQTQTRSIRALEKYGLIGDESKVVKSAKGLPSQMSPGAIVNSEQFRASPFQWMQGTFLPALARHGVKSWMARGEDGKMHREYDDRQVTDAISSLLPNRNSANLMLNMFKLQRQIERDSHYAATASGIDKSRDIAGHSLQGQQSAFKAQWENAKINLGVAITPSAISALHALNTGLDHFNHFARRHPQITAAMTWSVVGFTAAMGAAVPILMAYGGWQVVKAARDVIAARSTAMSTASVLKNTAATEANSVASVGRVGIIGRLGGAYRWVAGVAVSSLTAIRTGLSLLAGPVGIAVGAITFAGYEIWRHWQPIKSLFSGFAQGMGENLRNLASYFRPVGWVLNQIAQAIRVVSHLFTGLFGQVNYTSQQLKGWSDLGRNLAHPIDWLTGKNKQTLQPSQPTLAVNNTTHHNVTPPRPPQLSVISNPTPPQPINVPEPKAVVNGTNQHTMHVNNNQSFHITQQHGEDSEALAHRTAQLVRQAQAQTPYIYTGADRPTR